jgi:hypothetical protein
MHYLGYRELSGGRKVYCLRAEKVSTAEKASSEVKDETCSELPPRLAPKHAVLAKQLSEHQDEAPSPKTRQQGPSMNKKVTKVHKKVSQPRNTARKVQKPSQLLTNRSQGPASAAPASVARPQQRQRQRQQRQQQPHAGDEEEPAHQKDTTSSILPDWVRRAQLSDPEPVQQPPQQQQQRQQQKPEAAVPPPPPPPQQQQQQPGEPIDVFISRFLRNQAGLDLALVGRAVARYFKLNGEEKESFKAMMLDLAEAPSVEALQAFLEGMFEQH